MHRATDSAANHLEGAITSIVPVGNRVRVGVGGIVAEITAASLDRLALAEGGRVVASSRRPPRIGVPPPSLPPWSSS